MKKVLITILFLASINTLFADSLKVYVISASKNAGAKDGNLAAVQKYLNKMPNFKSFKLIGSSADVKFPAKYSQKFGDITVSCEGPQDKLKITVKDKEKDQLKTTVKLKKPLINSLKINGQDIVIIFSIN